MGPVSKYSDRGQARVCAQRAVVQRERWRIPYEGRENSGTLTTAGNLVFSGRTEGDFYAHDATTGEKLWEAEVPPLPATPVTYVLDGRQYVTILSSPGGLNGPPARVLTFVLDGNTPMPSSRPNP